MVNKKQQSNLRCQLCGFEIPYKKRRSSCCEKCQWEWKLIKRRAMADTKFLIAIGNVRSKPKQCESCFLNKPSLQLHHLNYNYPDRILYLCPRCHTQWHEKHGGAEYGRNG